MTASEILRDLLHAGPHPTDTLACARRFLSTHGFREETSPAGTTVAVRGRPTLAFCGHLDVVPPGEGWEHAHGAEEKGRIWGRGTSDMLGSVAAWLWGVAGSTQLPCATVLTTDEETTMGGARELAAAGALARFDALLIGEPTDFEIGIAEKGVLWLRATVQGRAAHASMPEEGVNAIEAAARAILRLRDLEVPGVHPLLGRPTLSVDTIQGGSAANVVPEQCSFDCDIRYLPPIEGERVIELVDATIQKAVDVHKLEVLGHHPAFETRRPSRLLAEAEAAVAAAGREARAVGLPYGTEASRYGPLGKDIIILGPGERRLAHTNRESIALADLEAATQIYRALAEARA
ncbi:MAG: M20/M25/M40 family metallo-hydrolase [Thermoplasmatota archaeon]